MATDDRRVDGYTANPLFIECGREIAMDPRWPALGAVVVAAALAIRWLFREDIERGETQESEHIRAKSSLDMPPPDSPDVDHH